MGLEPTTFRLATGRSTRMNYVRMAADYSPSARGFGSPPYSGVHQDVTHFVATAPAISAANRRTPSPQPPRTYVLR